ncbi:hypothetical protein CLOM_g14113 [Closterium sp. NIES-68]|nr:hypothetical protein CLOM_g14113 [Closterium sp. NIES-68]GJP61861.1 hypothetical protein CLOP_g18980 [Closterium sp. NIES-67]
MESLVASPPHVTSPAVLASLHSTRASTSRRLPTATLPNSSRPIHLPSPHQRRFIASLSSSHAISSSSSHLMSSPLLSRDSTAVRRRQSASPKSARLDVVAAATVTRPAESASDDSARSNSSSIHDEHHHHHHEHEHCAVKALEEHRHLSEEDFAQRWVAQKRRIVLFVEPSPFAYVCGYKNRFQNFIRYLREHGDEVLVVTTHKGVPDHFHGAKVVPSLSFPLPFYPILPLSLALSPRILKAVKDFKPDVIHATSPGIMCFGALVIAKLLSRPLVFSYHTHVPAYIPMYTFTFLIAPMWAVIRFVHLAAEVTLVTSHALGQELLEAGASAAERVCVWKKGVDCETFHPRFASHETRCMLTGGEPDKPLIVHVGRLGAEKNLEMLKPILDQLPGTRLAFIGDGPHRPTLEKLFEGTPTVFTGMLSGEPLSAAYASGDVFIMPSETETLGFVVLEAMAAGVPVVAARAGGIPDIIHQDGVTGFLFEPGNVEDATGKVRALLESRELRETVRAAAREEVEGLDWRASTMGVRDVHYATAVQQFLRKREAKEWLPWWVKGREWACLVKSLLGRGEEGGQVQMA